MSGPTVISEEEAALYDRQIRLWGLEAQSRLKNAKVLLLGMSPVSCEIIKNLVLSGINTLTLADDRVVESGDVEFGFLFEPKHVGYQRNISALKRAKELNGMVKLTCESNTSIEHLCSAYKDYEEVIICLDVSSGILNQWRECTDRFRSLPSPPKIHCVFSVGMHAIGFSDLGDFNFESDAPHKKSSGNGDQKTASNGDNRFSKITFPRLDDAFCVSWSEGKSGPLAPKRMPKGFYLLKILSCLTGSMSSQDLAATWPAVAAELNVPTSLLSTEDFESFCGQSHASVNAIVGGIISQEIIQGLSHNGTPKGNWYFMDGRNCLATVLWLPTLPKNGILLP